MAASIAVAILFEVVRLPAALLLGPLVAGAGMAIGNRPCVVPGRIFGLAQGAIGLMIASSLHANVLHELLHDFPTFLAGVFSVIAASALLGGGLAAWGVLPGTTAVWGAVPGVASAMVLMSASFGADIRLVAFMQYLRVVLVVLVATLMARFWGDAAGGAAKAVNWFPPVEPGALAGTALLIVLGSQLGYRLRLPAGAMMIPLVAGAVLSSVGALTISLPPWLMLAAYALVGWQVGARFDRPILLHAARAFPRLLASTIALIAVCGLIAAMLVLVDGVDPLTAYLATSPGGVDSIAIIGMAGQADMPFVMAMQTTRLIVILALGPWIARFVAVRVERRATQR